MKSLEQLKKEKKEQSSILDSGLETLWNVPSSAKQFAIDTITPLLSPIETAKNLVELGKGIYNLYTPGEQPSEEAARAVGKFYYDRYGGKDFNEVKSKVANTLKNDPVGFLADLAVPLSAARAPLKSSNIISKATKAVDPTLLLMKGLQKTPGAVKGITEATVGNIIKGQSGLGDGVLTTLAKGGEKGGDVLNAIRSQMSANKTLETTLQPVYSYMEGLQNVAKARKKEYLNSMENLGLEKIKIDPKVVKNNLNKTIKEFTQSTKRGQVGTPKINAKIKEINNLVDDWMQSPELHTVDGLDFLKQSLDDFMPDATSVDRTGALVTSYRNSLRKTILDNSPEYGPVMQAYEQSKTLEKQVKKALGSGKIEDVESIARKLQSTTRNNANTSFGLRGNLLDEISEIGGQPNLPYQLAAQSADTFIPRGLGRYTAGGVGAAGVGAGVATSNPLFAFMAALNAGASSPRLLGETAIKFGQAKRLASPALTNIDNINTILKPNYAPILRTSRVIGAADDEIDSDKEKQKILEDFRKSRTP